MISPRDIQKPVKIGLFGIGLDTYWPQFDGLKDRLLGYQKIIARKLARPNVEIVDCGLVDSPEKARAAADMLKAEDVRLIFLYVSTYALSSTVLPVVQKAGVPIIVLNLQPVAAIDYTAFNALKDRTKMTGEWLAHCQACSVPEIANVFLRAGILFHQITGVLENDPTVWREADAWIDASRAADTLRENRVGLLGHPYCGMLDIYSDLTRHCATFGNHFEYVEMTALRGERDAVTDVETQRKIAEIHEYFDIQPDCSPEEIRRAARTAVAMDRLVEKYSLGALAYFYNGNGDPEYVDLISSVIVGASMLTAQGVPVAGEYEVKNVQAMKIMDALDAGGSFTEFYAMDFVEDIILMGHDGPGHVKIAEGRTKLKPLDVYHGKVGRGLSVEMSVRHGAVTLLSVIDTPSKNGGQKLRLLVAEGESVPGPILEIGNTNSRYRFSVGARGFIDAWCAEGPAHHCAVGVGHVADKIEKLGKILGMEVVRVC